MLNYHRSHIMTPWAMNSLSACKWRMAFLDDDADIPLAPVWQNCVMEWRCVTRAISANSEFSAKFIPGGICLLFNLLESSVKRRSSAINLKIRKHFRKAFQRLAQFTWNSCVFAKRNALVCARKHTAPRERERESKFIAINKSNEACVCISAWEYIYSGQWAATQKMIICKLSE